MLEPMGGGSRSDAVGCNPVQAVVFIAKITARVTRNTVRQKNLASKRLLA